MVNTNKLKGKVIESGMNIGDLAKRINVNRSTLYRKLGKEGPDFTISEADKIAKELNMSKQEAVSIFFSQFVASCATTEER